VPEHRPIVTHAPAGFERPSTAQTAASLPPVVQPAALETAASIFSSAASGDVFPPLPATSASTAAAASNLDAFLSTAKPMEYDNPWDWVPDQVSILGLSKFAGKFSDISKLKF
jgi:hypothetical protein